MGGIDDLAHPIHVGSEGSHQNPVVPMLVEAGVKGLAHRPLRHGKSRLCGIGALAEHGQNSFLSQFCQSLQICRLAEHRSIVDLEVSRVEQNARRGEDGQGAGVHNAVVHLDELHPETAKIDGLSVLNHLSLRILQHVVLF